MGDLDVGRLLRQRRVAADLSQGRLALRAGTKQSTISRIENGREIPTVDRLHDLLVALGDELLLEAQPLDPARPLTDIAADRAKSMGQRLEDGFALSKFASELVGAAGP